MTSKTSNELASNKKYEDDLKTQQREREEIKDKTIVLMENEEKPVRVEFNNKKRKPDRDKKKCFRILSLPDKIRKYFFKKHQSKEEDIKMGTFGGTFWVAMGFGGDADLTLSYKNAFIVLTFATLFFLLVATAALNIVVYTNDDVKEFILRFNLFHIIGLVIVMMVSGIMMSCIPICRECPCVALFLLIGTSAAALITAYITATTNTEIIYLAFVTTSVVIFICTLTAVFGFDFTSCLSYLVIVSLAVTLLMSILFIAMFYEVQMSWGAIAILMVGTIVQCVIYIVELQLILCGRSVELGAGDWPFAAFMLYTSIIDIFIRILQLVSYFED